jgi:hypothetical protein
MSKIKVTFICPVFNTTIGALELGESMAFLIQPNTVNDMCQQFREDFSLSGESLSFKIELIDEAV